MFKLDNVRDMFYLGYRPYSIHIIVRFTNLAESPPSLAKIRAPEVKSRLSASSGASFSSSVEKGKNPKILSLVYKNSQVAGSLLFCCSLKSHT